MTTEKGTRPRGARPLGVESVRVCLLPEQLEWVDEYSIRIGDSRSRTIRRLLDIARKIVREQEEASA